MVVLGIDPGFALTGWAILDFADRSSFTLQDYGVIVTEKEESFPKRLNIVYEDMLEIIDTYKPDIAGLETLIFHKNVKTAITVGEARGVIMLSLEQRGLKILEFNPLQIKNSIAGFGRANKKQVQENVQRLCGLAELPKPDDAADAIAVAICCYDSLKMELINNLNS
jgi:crossover junction endodeoxyribonuclease RuvC